MSSSVHKVAVVTGAGSGIGAAVAHALAAEGRVVVLAGRRRDALAAVAERGAGLAGVLDPVPADVTDEASVRALFDRAVDRHGRVDLLFNNAGTGAPARDLDAVPLAEWEAVVAVNLTGAFLCTREASGSCAGRTRRAAASSTTGRSPPTPRDLARWRTPPPSTPSPG